MIFKSYLRILKPMVKKVALWFFIIMMITSIITALNLFNLQERLLDLLNSTFEDLGHLINEEGEINTTLLILNNSRVSFIGFILGIIPFLYLPSLVLAFNGAIIGLLFGSMATTGISGVLGGIMVFLLGIVPHGIFELPGIFISISTGIILCKSYRDKSIKFGEAFKYGLLTVILICLPLMVIAGIIETQVTPKLLGTVMGF